MITRSYLLVFCIGCSIAATASAVPAASVAVAVAPELQAFVDKHELVGAVVLVADRDRVLDIETVGFADIAAGHPMAPDARFWIASQSKSMTAAAVMMLVDEGKINLDDPAENYLPEFRGQMVVAEKDGDYVLLKRPSHPITVREILSHVSGLPFKSAIEEPTLDGLPLDKAVRGYAMTPPERGTASTGRARTQMPRFSSLRFRCFLY
jgi:CubicO group peptidase (beta-lactamase class C family)